MSEENEFGFKVSDRRLFKPDGTPRELEPEPEPVAPPPTEIQTAPPTVIRPEEIFSTQTAAQPAREPKVQQFAQAGAIEEEEPEMTDFMQFLYSLASSTTFIHLGLMEHPATGKPEVNLPAAQQGIGMLLMLRDKTKGNLNRTEEEFFESLLSDLQMQFVSLRNG